MVVVGIGPTMALFEAMALDSESGSVLSSRAYSPKSANAKHAQLSTQPR